LILVNSEARNCSFN